MKARVCVLISGGGTNLGALIRASDTGEMNSAQLSLVLSSNPQAYGLVRAERAGIDHFCVDRKATPSREAFEAKLLEKINAYSIDLIVLAGFMHILSADFIKRSGVPILNVHPSLIPSFCGEGYYGLKVHEAALAYGVKVTGATVHYVNEVPDGGEILMQKSVEILDTDTPETLQKRVMQQAEHVILPLCVQKVSKEIVEKKQRNEAKQ